MVITKAVMRIENFLMLNIAAMLPSDVNLEYKVKNNLFVSVE
jgi:hypothetical protein